MDIRSVLSLCSGTGMLDLGLRLAIPDARTVCYVEIEAFACEILASRMEDKVLDEAPIWTDLKTFDGKPWRGKVDCIIGGYPCQPFSVAGRQRGEKDPRHLWPYISNIIRDVRPRYCFFENVENHLNIGFSEVRDELQAMGYNVKAGIFSAEEVGAPHQRKRLFILADAECIGWGGRSEVVRPSKVSGCETAKTEATGPSGELASQGFPTNGVLDTGELGLVVDPNVYGCSVSKLPRTGEDGEEGRSECSETFWSVRAGYTPIGLPEDSSGSVGDANREREPQQEGIEPQERGRIGNDGDYPAGTRLERWLPKGAGEGSTYSRKMVYTDCKRLEGWDKYCSRELPTWPPSPKSGAWHDVGEELRPAIIKTEPPLFRVADGMGSWMDRLVDSDRTDRLRAVGNGVVPLTAAIAISVLGDIIV